METFVQLLISGLLSGGVYALMAVGLTLTLGVLRIPNFAHGEFVMIGMYATYALYQALGINAYLSIPMVAVALFLLGAMIERVLVRRTLGQGEMVQVFLTVGLSLFLVNAALVLAGGDYRTVPLSFAASSFTAGPFHFAKPQAFAFLGAGLVMLMLFLFLNHTDWGKRIRAVGDDRSAAVLMGINVDRVYLLTFGLALGLTGASAALLTTLFPVFPTVGTYFVLLAFVVVVLGGLGSTLGALVGGLLIGVVESLSGYYVGQGWKQAVYFGIFLIALVLRPQGIFGRSSG